ncbi:MAG: DoxX family protein [Proteobacteria bacterium]|nr:DoxX family protein [Pseudomonadota bacterium]
MNKLQLLLRPYVLLVTRLLISFVFLWHGLPKAINIDMAMDKFAGFGLPGLLGPITGWIEVIAAVLVVLGVKHLWANIALSFVIVGAIVTVQIPGGFTAGLERDLLILTATLVLSVFGPGMLALDKSTKAAH